MQKFELGLPEDEEKEPGPHGVGEIDPSSQYDPGGQMSATTSPSSFKIRSGVEVVEPCDD
jgi:hypothetical protein